jgi:hypothetical protein
MTRQHSSAGSRSKTDVASVRRPARLGRDRDRPCDCHASGGATFGFAHMQVFDTEVRDSMSALPAPLAVSEPGAWVGEAACKCRNRVESDLLIGSVDDPLEHEADRVADRVTRMPDNGFALTATHGQISRKCACEEDEKPNTLQAKPAGPVAQEAPAIVHQVLGSPGQPLDARSREFFEPRFGRDFSDVRIHVDSTASESARDINAFGYTVGRHVVFAEGQYSPETTSGRRLLAHELAHAVQQAPRTMTELATAGASARTQSAQPDSGSGRLTAGVVRRQENPRRRWDPKRHISVGIGIIQPVAASCITGTDATGVTQACGNFSGRPFGEYTCEDGATYVSVCPFPCVGQPLNLAPYFWVDDTLRKRPQPFDPPNLSATIVFYPDAGDPDVVIRETSTGKYVAPGAPLETGFGDFSFYSPDSPGRLMVSLAIADPSSGEVAVYSESIPVINCPLVATEPEPEPAKPATPPKGRQTRFNIEVQDPDNAPLVYEFVGPNTPLEGPGGFFPVWQDATGAYYYLNNGRRVYLPNFSPP